MGGGNSIIGGFYYLYRGLNHFFMKGRYETAKNGLFEFICFCLYIFMLLSRTTVRLQIS